MEKIDKPVTALLVFLFVMFTITIFFSGVKHGEEKQKETHTKKEEVSIAVEIAPIETLTVAITEEEEVLIDEHRDMDFPVVYGEYADGDSEETETDTQEVRSAEPYTFSEDEIWEMTRIVYLENGIDDESTDTTIYLTACVILNRLYDWDECSTVYDVIWQGGQYSTANRYTDYNGGELGSTYPDGWGRSYNAVCSAIENCDRNPHFQSTFAQGSVYYVDPNTGETFCY